ncbi:hypothetical protein ACFOWE_05800 [Planomonospora corallina]|uniref:Uncharacterized protein n=1 Tax=Planomonospora corallina TaxID=1806052 RepID=A0ABV8I105_9ACTN
MAETEAVLQALSRRETVSEPDHVVRLLTALIEDVDQCLSSVSITPSA